MKITLSILFVLLGANLFCTGLNAQPLSRSLLLAEGNTWRALNEFYRVHPGPKLTAAKAASVGSRLIKEVRGNYNASHQWLPDSTVYSFSAGRGGDYENLITPYPLKYDSSLSWTTDPVTLNYKLARRTYQMFNVRNDLAQQVLQLWSGSAWVNNQRTIISYNAAAQIDTVLTQSYNSGTSSWVNASEITYSFNAGGFIVGSSYDTWVSATNTFQTQVAYQYTLDGADNRVLELESSYDNVTMTLKPAFRVFHHFNSSNVEISYAFQQASGSNWVNTDSTSFLLNTGNQVTEYLYYTWNTATSSWQKTSHLLETYTATGKLGHELDQAWNNSTGIYTTTDSTSSIFNSYDQVMVYHYFSLQAGTNDAETHYYYEQYTPAGISSVANNGGQLTVYPNPANNELHLSLKWDVPQSLYGTITDITGKRCIAFTAPSAQAFSTSLALSDLPAGNYFLLIKGSAGGSASQVISLRR